MRIAHLLKRSSFLAAAESGRRFRSHAFTVQVLTHPDAPTMPLRIGLTASRKTGNAVERNRIRRRLRAAADKAFKAETLLATDIVIVARREILSEPFGKLVSALAEAPGRAKTRLSSKPVKSLTSSIPAPPPVGAKRQS